MHPPSPYKSCYVPASQPAVRISMLVPPDLDSPPLSPGHSITWIGEQTIRLEEKAQSHSDLHRRIFSPGAAGEDLLDQDCAASGASMQMPCLFEDFLLDSLVVWLAAILPLF